MSSNTAVLDLPRRRLPLPPPALVFGLAVAAALWFGLHAHTERYISPQHGLGYALGIVGGSLMLVLLLYPLRKRVPWLRFLGSMRMWFRAHMVLGVIGPLLVLYHANFSTGATNSNVALVCMLVVSGSGLFGRYFYSHIHHGLYGNRATLAELKASAQMIRGKGTSLNFLPDMLSSMDRAEQRWMRLAALPGLQLVSPLLIGLSSLATKLELRGRIHEELKAAAQRSEALAEHQRRLKRLAIDHMKRRLGAASRVATFHAYERLFSLWHVLHLPLFFMMIIAGIVHVIAVHVY